MHLFVFVVVGVYDDIKSLSPHFCARDQNASRVVVIVVVSKRRIDMMNDNGFCGMVFGMFFASTDKKSARTRGRDRDAKYTHTSLHIVFFGICGLRPGVRACLRVSMGFGFPCAIPCGTRVHTPNRKKPRPQKRWRHPIQTIENRILSSFLLHRRFLCRCVVVVVFFFWLTGRWPPRQNTKTR